MTNAEMEQNAMSEGLVVRSLRFRGIQCDVRPHTRDYAQTQAERINRAYVRCAERMATLRASIASRVLADGIQVAQPKHVFAMAIRVAQYRAKCAVLEAKAANLSF